MVVVVQRVSEARVDIDEQMHSEIGRGALVLLGVEQGDSHTDVNYLARKVVQLRMFPDEQHHMNRSLQDVKGEMLIVSQFTLAGDCRKGRRPSFDKAAPPEEAEVLYESFVEAVAAVGVPVKTGKFAAMMNVALNNDGPVTFVLRTKDGTPV